MEEYNVARRCSENALSSRIAALVHACFDALPSRCKPIIRDGGLKEWIPMSGIVAVKGYDTPSEKLTCVVVTTGARCLPASRIPQCRGLVLHDCHAEILAIRAFNYWLLNECRSALSNVYTLPPGTTEAVGMTGSAFVQMTSTGISARQLRSSSIQQCSNPSIPWPPFEICPDVKIFMYCTCAPCGDASMEICMAAQQDPTPWSVTHKPEREMKGSIPPSIPASLSARNLLDGRANFSLLGVVRRKPARADAESTLSKSCSDKLALRQVISLLSYPSSLLVAPTQNSYLAGLVLPDEEINHVAFERAFGAAKIGRMKDLVGRVWSCEGQLNGKYGYGYHPFEILSVSTKEIEALWPFSKPKVSPKKCSANRPEKAKPSNISAVWIAAPSLRHVPKPEGQNRQNNDFGAKRQPKAMPLTTGVLETLVNGVRQGNCAMSVTARGASVLSRARMWSLLCDIVQESRFCTTWVTPAGNQIVDIGDSNLISNYLRESILEARSYDDLKRPSEPRLQWIRLRELAMQDAKAVLQPWVHNHGDEAWNL